MLTVPESAPIGKITNLIVRGVASGLADRTAALTLEIWRAPITLSLSSPTLTTSQGGAPVTTTVNVTRNENFAGSVLLYVDMDGEGGLPAGVTAAFATNPVTGTTSVLTITASATAVTGTHTLWVWAEVSPEFYYVTTLTVTVTQAAGAGGAP